MEFNIAMKPIVSLTWACFFLLPFGYLIYRLSLLGVPANLIEEFLFDMERIRVAWQTLKISIYSTALIMLFGSFIGFSLLSVKRVGFIKLSLLLPAFTPSLFVITSVMALASLIGWTLPLGLESVVAVHVLMDTGLAAVFFHDLVTSKMSSQLRLAFIEGASRWQVFKACIKTLQNDLLFLASAFFLFCFTSFSIPLIVGGNSGKTLEVLSYELLHLNANLWGATGVALMQMLVYAIFNSMLIEPVDTKVSRGHLNLRSFGWPYVSTLSAFLILFICYWGVLWEVPIGFQDLLANSSVVEQLPFMILRSLWLAVLGGFGAFVLFCLVIYFIDIYRLRKFTTLYAAVSTSLLGISIYLINFPMDLKLTYAYTLLFFPVAYRLYGASLIAELKPQYETLKVLGASRGLGYFKILFPQALPTLIRLSGFVAIWVIGDYGITSVITGENLSMALFTKSLLGGYRTEAAAAMSFLILFFIGMIYLTAEFLSYVSRRKLYS